MAILLSTIDGNQISGAQARALHQSVSPMRDYIIPAYAEQFNTPTPSGFVATVGSGMAVVDGVIVENTAGVQLTMPTPTTTGSGCLVLNVNLATKTASFIFKTTQTLLDNNLVSTATASREIPLYVFNYSPSGITAWEDARPFTTSNGSPAGIIQMYAGGGAPAGWLVCDGREVNKLRFANLYKYIGGAYGQTATTFKVPDLRGRVVVGYNANDPDFNGIGKVGGEKTHKLTGDELPMHRLYADTMSSGPYYDNAITPTLVNPGNAYGMVIPKIGKDVAHNNLQPYTVFNYIIKV